MNKSIIPQFALVSLLSACSGPTPSGTTEQSDGAPDTTRPEPDAALPDPCGLHSGYTGDDRCLAAPSDGIQLHYGPASYDDPGVVAPYMLAPGEEITECAIVLPSHPQLWIASYEASERSGFHHLTVFTAAANTPLPTANPCTGATTNIFLIQSAHEDRDVTHGAPEYAGAAFGADAGAFVMQIHAINSTEAPMMREVWLNLHTVASTDKPLTWVSVSGGHTMAVPPQTKQTIKSSAAPVGYARTLVELSGHMHAHSTEMRASFDGKLIYSTRTWAEPDSTWYTSNGVGAVTIPAGQPLTWECDVNNDTDATLRFGNQVQTAEMCNLFGIIAGVKPWAGYGG